VDSETSVRRRTGLKLAVALVSIVVVSAAVGWFIIRDLIDFCGCGEHVFIDFSSMQEAGGNWSMSVTSAPSGFALANVTMTIYDSGGTVKMPMSSIQLSRLTAANWSVYGVVYQKKGTEDQVVPGAIVLVNESRYPAGYFYEISDTSGILANGIFG
jgi:hypothetical protein